MEEKYKDLIDRLTAEIYNKAVDSLLPSQMHSELKKDIKQDLWLELYSHIAANPDADLDSVKKRLNNMSVTSLPDPRMISVSEMDWRIK